MGAFYHDAGTNNNGNAVGVYYCDKQTNLSFRRKPESIEKILTFESPDMI